MAKREYLKNCSCDLCANGHNFVFYEWAHCVKIWSKSHHNFFEILRKKQKSASWKTILGGVTSSRKLEIPAFVFTSSNVFVVEFNILVEKSRKSSETMKLGLIRGHFLQRLRQVLSNTKKSSCHHYHSARSIPWAWVPAIYQHCYKPACWIYYTRLTQFKQLFNVQSSWDSDKRCQ